MVIVLSGVQYYFGLKSYTFFLNQTSVQCEFDFKSEVWFQTKIAIAILKLQNSATTEILMI